MRVRTIVAFSPTAAIADQIASAVVPLGVPCTKYSSTGDAPSDALWIIHYEGEDAKQVLAQVPAGCKAILLLQHSGLAPVVELMQSSDRIAAMFVVDRGIDGAELAAAAKRLIDGAIIGLDKVMEPGTEIAEQIVRDRDDRMTCMHRISQAAELSALPRAYDTAVEQCADEMLANALYDAPVDAEGKRMYAHLTAVERNSIDVDHAVVVQFACDSQRFGLSVRDGFGTLDRNVALRVLYKCLHAKQQVDRRAAGAGIGLFLMLNSASGVELNVIPGVATEVICTFDLDAQSLALKRFGFFAETADVTGKLVPATRARARPVAKSARSSKLPIVVAAAAVLVAAAAIATWLAWPKPAPQPPEAKPIATAMVLSEPGGADVELDGKLVGTTPLALTKLAPNSTAAAVLHLRGYRDAKLAIHVPALGATERFIARLEPSDQFAHVTFESTPAGARVVALPAVPSPDRTYTPADVLVEVGKPLRFALDMPGHLPALIEPFTVERGATVTKSATLVAAATLHIAIAKPGSVTISNAPHCTALPVPGSCVLAPGTYTVDYVGANGIKLTRKVEMTTADATLDLDAP